MKGKTKKDKTAKGENGYSFLKTIKRMIVIVRAEAPKLIWLTVLATVVKGLYPFCSIFLPKIAIGVLEEGGDEVVKNLIYAMLMYFVAAGIITFLNSYVEEVLFANCMTVRMGFIAKQSAKLQQMDYKYIEDAKFFEKYDKAMNANNNDRDGVEGVYNRMTKFPAKIVALIGMLVLGVSLNPLIVLALILHVAVTMFVSAKTHDFEYARKEDLAKAGRRVGYYEKTSADFRFGKDIRIFDLRDRILKNYKQEIRAYSAVRALIENKKFALGFLSLVTLLISNVTMYGLLAYKAYNGMPISDFTMYIALITSLLALMIDIGNDVTFMRNEGQYVDDYFRMMDAPLLTEGDKDVDASDSVEIVFDHVTFRYPNTEKDVFKDFSFTIHRGERLAVVGVNGAGKSTLVKLICGLFEPTEGHIYINGIDIREIKKENLYSLYSTVFQDFNILAFSLRDNVTCGVKENDDEKVREVLVKTGLGKKLDSLDRGLDQMMLKVIDENGTDFSGGERQKLAIARALYKDAPMVIMDEPTAALDALAEAEIYESFADLVKGKTAIYVSHRLASTRFCDKIALFDNTGIIEYGTHDELMEKKGEYYNMFVIQGKYYRENPNADAEEAAKENNGEVA